MTVNQLAIAELPIQLLAGRHNIAATVTQEWEASRSALGFPDLWTGHA